MSTDDGTSPPLYHRIKSELREAIARGEHVPDVPFITQREVCARFGVSTTTAVRALNELVAEGVLVRRRGRGTFVADRRPGASGADAVTSPPARDHRTIACIVHDLNGAHNAGVVSGVESTCAELGYRMFLSDSGGSPEREERALRQVMDSGAAGAVVYPVQGHSHPEVYAELRERGIPVVFVDRYRPDIAVDAVLPDNFAVGYEITNRLIELGHRHIAVLWSETDCSSVRDRLAGHHRSLQEHGTPLRPELTLLRPYWTKAGGTQTSILRQLLDSPERPTVLLCANGFVLAAAASDLLALGIGIPEQVELAGMDNAGPFDLLPLTTVAAVLPSKQMGSRAMAQLAERIASEDPYHATRHSVLPITVRTRAETAGYLQAVSTTNTGDSAAT